jgi:L-iditol 2-dehydrogenase
MADTVRAVVMTAPHAPLEMRRMPAPRAAPGGAVLETLLSEVCGTDVHLHHGQLAGVPYPIIPGHVSCGRVLETNGPLADVDGRPIAPGDVVTFYDVFGICGSCWHCLVARAGTRCPHRKVYGITTGAGDGLLGGWADRIELRPGVRVVPLPEGVEPLAFMGGGCGLATGFHAVERGRIALGTPSWCKAAGRSG